MSIAAVRFAHCVSNFSYFVFASRRLVSSVAIRWSLRIT
eukprot:CAMPEP_0179006610 /NCGR_PEP_ID=MMETSP0795-20121207/14662_1 /TAXON_ID=88552 /ORGANISM="Amoebophrya sp., Strain Ameob2" /LENGTH=38 /DNA_ID= /DNA_START= /DNA_END= /DNA_ORIENTATION=